MDIQIKKYADNKDLKALKYIFVDALDVDPTFVRYEEEYNYCKSIPGLLEAHIELTPFSFDKSQWNEDYWTNLKIDLIKNFSDRRMMHMREVAKVFLAEKVVRILDERSSVAAPTVTPVIVPDTASVKTESLPSHVEKTSKKSRAEQEKRELEEAKRKLEEENRKVEAARQAEAKRIEQQRMQHQDSISDKVTGDSSKKVIGIVLAALVVVAIVLILVLK